MSTTAPEQAQAAPPPNTAGTAETASTGGTTQTQPAAPAEAATAAEQREYTLFEEARSDTWTKLGVALAKTPEAALESLGEQKLKSGQRFMAIPSRFVVPRKPQVKVETTISFD